MIIKKNAAGNIKILPVLLSVIIVLSGCIFSSPEAKLVTPVIRVIGLPDLSSVDSITLTVTGPGMDPVEVSYSELPSVINISVPEGTEREFELTVTTGSGYAGPIASYRGTATADVTLDSTVVELTMGIGSTKLVMPDARNARLVQIDDMLGTNWTTLSSSDLTGWAVYYRPWDVDFDSEGRIIVVNNGVATGDAVLWAVDSIDSSVYTPLYIGNGGFIAVTVDRENRLIYFASTSGQLYSCDYFGTNVISTYDMTGISLIRGMAVSNGMLYLAAEDSGDGMPIVSKYDPSNGGSVVKTINTDLISPRDVMVKDGYVYIADYDNTGGSNHKIIRLSMDLDSPVELPNSGTHPMLGPQRFIAVLNKEIYFIDDADNYTNYDKFVAMDDILGNGWTSYGSEGSGTGQFAFYYGC